MVTYAELGRSDFGGDEAMSYTKEKKLYELIPAVYRQHDSKIGKPLKGLIDIIEEQLEILENDIKNLYDNWFIETCDDWVIPYIGDLVGAKLLRSVENATLSQRAWVANTISYRTMKGTAAVLEQLALDVTGWNAKAVEFFELLSTTQYINHLRSANVRAPDLRDTERLELLNNPFDTIPHTVDVRNIRSEKSRGYYNIQNVGIFLWRLYAYPVINAPAFDRGDGKYSFSQLGYDIPLFSHPVTEPTITHLAEEVNVPSIIRRLQLKNHIQKYYGVNKSILLIENGFPVSIDRIVVCNLSNEWKHRPSSGKIAIDPILGRIAFPIGENPEKVNVSYYYGFSADIGGGFYDREPSNFEVSSSDVKLYRISKIKPAEEGIYPSIPAAIREWQETQEKPSSAIFEIMDSEFYGEPFHVTLQENESIVIKSSQNQRPVLRRTIVAPLIQITGSKGSKMLIEGLLIDQETIKVNPGDLQSLRISHCTLVPGENTSIEVEGENNSLTLALQRSISGKIMTKESEARLEVKDSIVDAKEKDHHHKHYAVECYKASIENSTIFGKVSVTLMELASNTIFTDIVTATRRQEGCVRFSYVPKGSKVPRLYRCQPLEEKLRPLFTSELFGDPGYAQLHKDVAQEIFNGGDNGAEMGAFNHLYQPQRLENLESSLDEYLRFGLEAGIQLVDLKREYVL
jgi:hypothetical protein